MALNPALNPSDCQHAEALQRLGTIGREKEDRLVLGVVAARVRAVVVNRGFSLRQQHGHP